MSTPKKPSAANLIAESLLHQGCEYVFGIVGYPMYALATACQRAGLKYIGCRNEQAASYAAAATGYLTGRPGVCVVVTGPGVVHAVAGMANAKENCWPMLCLGGSHERDQRGLGAFQENGQNGDIHQLDYVRPATKYATVLDDARRIPFFIEQAVRYSIEGRPGATYLDMPADLMREVLEDPASIPRPPRCPEPRLTLSGEDDIGAAVTLLQSAKAPLLIVGKGAAYAGAGEGLRRLVEVANCPFLPTPMGKGTIPDDHELNVAAARSTALAGADVVLLVGARLNWILHYGQPPRYHHDVKFIKIDISAEEMHNGTPAAVALVGHARSVVEQLNKALAVRGGFAAPSSSPWWQKLKNKVDANGRVSSDLASDRSVPMNYYTALTAIQNAMPRDAMIMSEGANTMDIGRTILLNYLPRSRLDAGSFGTMGVGFGQILAFCAVHPKRKCVAVVGDSAFGFSGMEYETVCRYKFNALIIVLNNNGILSGSKKWLPEWDVDPYKIPPSSLKPSNNYEKMAEVFGGQMWLATTPDELDRQLPAAMASVGPGIFHVRIDPAGNRKTQEFAFDPTAKPSKSKL